MKNIRIVSFLLAIVMLTSIFCVSCSAGNADYEAAVALYEEGKYEEALTAFEAIKDYEDSKSWIKKCKNALLDIDYKAAVTLLDEGKVVEGYEALVALGDYKDSADKAAEVYDQYKSEKLKSAKVGDVVMFGQFEQDNDETNGPEAIEWIVLDVQDGKAFLLSKYILEFKKYKEKSPHSWASSEVRTWLNGVFYNESFNNEEAAKIQTTTLPTDTTEKYQVMMASSKDKVFALNISEASKYLGSDKKCEMTPYAKAHSNKPDQVLDFGESWLRVVEKDQSSPYVIQIDGSFGTASGRLANGVRPAMWINFNA